MTLNLIAIPGDMAEPLEAFVLPQVWQLPDREQFWYIAARDENDALAGVAVIDPVKPTAELLSIAVSPACTRLGVATEMLACALDLLAQTGIEGLRAACSLPEGEESPLSGLLEANGFVRDEPDRYTYETSLEEAVKHPLLAMKEEPSAPVCLKDLSHLERRNLSAQLAGQGLGPEILEECDPQLSFVYRGEEEMQAIFLLSPLEESRLNILWTWLSPKSAKSRALVELFAAAFRKAAGQCPGDTKVAYTCTSDASDRLFRHFFPDRSPVETIRVYYSGTASQEELEWKEPEA